jgi:hypothetical protein
MLTNQERYQLKLRIATALDEHRQGDGVTDHSEAEEWWCCVEAVAEVAEEFYDGHTNRNDDVVDFDYGINLRGGFDDDLGFESWVDKLPRQAPVIQYRPGGRRPQVVTGDPVDAAEEIEDLVGISDGPAEAEREAC